MAKGQSDGCLTALLPRCGFEDSVQQGAFLLGRTIQLTDGVTDEVSVDVSDAPGQLAPSGLAGRLMYDHMDRSVCSDGPHLPTELLYERGAAISTYGGEASAFQAGTIMIYW